MKPQKLNITTLKKKKKKAPSTPHTRLTQSQIFFPQLFPCARDGHSNLLPFSCPQPREGSFRPYPPVSSSFPPGVDPAPKHWPVLRRPNACHLCPGPSLWAEHQVPPWEERRLATLCGPAGRMQAAPAPTAEPAEVSPASPVQCTSLWECQHVEAKVPGLPWWPVAENPPVNAADIGSIPESRRSP